MTSFDLHTWPCCDLDLASRSTQSFSTMHLMDAHLSTKFDDRTLKSVLQSVNKSFGINWLPWQRAMHWWSHTKLHGPSDLDTIYHMYEFKTDRIKVGYFANDFDAFPDPSHLWPRFTSSSKRWTTCGPWRFIFQIKFPSFWFLLHLDTTIFGWFMRTFKFQRLTFLWPWP